jgi:hypothetical protein
MDHLGGRSREPSSPNSSGPARPLRLVRRIVQFVDIEDGLSFPLPLAAELEAYVVYVGFDEIGDKNEKKPARSAKMAAPFPI